ncbi:amino acid transporter [Ascoidea rubescens DSM 1968]|uniref:Amino acid transporter n=1 Tax=Ascoidea rubescens DSM 1968 TaxID=1344418 RepID=A0A1D2VD05_9ASCO|nr:amino acid transporter [Ascoidea rubescens DSM 1968]ODV59400.1 amino acid transporter [Ascoidea rubescens DSM 1968]
MYIKPKKCLLFFTNIRSTATGEIITQLSPIRSPLEQKIINTRSHKNDDNALLADIGYRPELRRYFTTLQVFGIAFSIMGSLPSIASVLGLALAGGMVGFVWGWIVASFFILLIGISMAELGSAIPTSGGLYYWTYHYAPQSVKIPLSFLVGNTNSIALTGALCSVDYGLANEILSVVVINSDGTFEITSAKTYGVYVACVISHIFITCLASNIWVIGAFDSTIHQSEEAKNATKAVPIGIIGSISVCGILGWIICIVIAACVDRDLEVIVETSFGQPMAQIVYDILGKKWAVAIMVLIAFCQWLMGASILTAISRQIWAFSRDNGLPSCDIIKVVNKKWSVPIRVVWFGGILAIIMGLLCLIGTTAANALFTLYVCGNYFAWGTPIFLRMVYGKDIFKPGPFYTGDVLSPIINWIAIVFIVFTMILAMFPSSKIVDKETMNYTVTINEVDNISEEEELSEPGMTVEKVKVEA